MCIMPTTNTVAPILFMYIIAGSDTTSENTAIPSSIPVKTLDNIKMLQNRQI